MAPSKLKLLLIKEKSQIWQKSALVQGYNSWFGHFVKINGFG